MHACVRACMHACIHSFIHFIRSFWRYMFIYVIYVHCSFFLYAFSHWFIDSLIHSFVRSIILSFIHVNNLHLDHQRFGFSHFDMKVDLVDRFNRIRIRIPRAQAGPWLGPGWTHKYVYSVYNIWYVFSGKKEKSKHSTWNGSKHIGLATSVFMT